MCPETSQKIEEGGILFMKRSSLTACLVPFARPVLLARPVLSVKQSCAAHPGQIKLRQAQGF